MDQSKRYLIEILLNKSTLKRTIEENIKTIFNMCQNTYQIPSDSLNKINSLYNYDIYLERVVEIFDENFLEEELKELIQCCSSRTMQKLLSPYFQKKIGEQSEKFMKEIEQSFIRHIK